EFKHTPARIRPYRETWKGFVISRQPLAAPAGMDLVWRRITQDGCHLHEFAGRGDETEAAALRRALVKGLDGEVVAYEDAAVGSRREAWLAGGRIQFVLFTTTSGRLPPRDWLVDLFLSEDLDAEARGALLFGRPP